MERLVNLWKWNLFFRITRKPTEPWTGSYPCKEHEDCFVYGAGLHTSHNKRTTATSQTPPQSGQCHCPGLYTQTRDPSHLEGCPYKTYPASRQEQDTHREGSICQQYPSGRYYCEKYQRYTSAPQPTTSPPPSGSQAARCEHTWLNSLIPDEGQKGLWQGQTLAVQRLCLKCGQESHFRAAVELREPTVSGTSSPDTTGR